MLSCEHFEQNWTTWKAAKLAPVIADEMLAHSLECAHCRHYTAETDELRTLLEHSSLYQPSAEFAANLEQAILDIRRRDVARSMRAPGLFPRWAVLSAGLATGLAIGLMLLLPGEIDEQPNSNLAAVTPPPTAFVPDERLAEQTASSQRADEPVKDTLRARQDTAVSPPFEVNQRSRMVSSGGR
ncbi:MAG: hypothetical protein FJY65_01595 [Calditrichaeota bacterium]|nr:hypothetical protein [Calditrichota bacterium]